LAPESILKPSKMTSQARRDQFFELEPKKVKWKTTPVWSEEAFATYWDPSAVLAAYDELKEHGVHYRIPIVTRNRSELVVWRQNLIDKY